MRILGSCATVFAGALLMASLPKGSGAQDVPLPTAYKSLVVSAGAITTSANELLQIERAATRLQRIRKSLTSEILSHKFGDKISLADASLDAELEEQAMLCNVRADHLITTVRYNYLSSVVTQIQEISKATPATDLASALKGLFASYAVKATAASMSDQAIKTLQARTRARCQTDIRSFDTAYYGASIKVPVAATAAPEAPAAALPGLDFLGPIGALVDTVLGVVTPVIVEAANLVDEGKRAQAVKDFLSNPKNQNALKHAGHELARAISIYTLDKRRKLAGSFVEGLVAVRHTEIDLGKLDACKGLNDEKFTRSKSGAPSVSFMLCWRAAWTKLESTITAMLKTAEDYDQLADAGDTDTALRAYDVITADLDAIRDNEISDPTAFWQYVTQLVSFANTLDTAFSPANRDKIQKAIDTLVKG